MEKQLEKICTPFNLSKLAYIKGFRELCVFGVNNEEYFPISDIDNNFIFEYFEKEDSIEVYYCPTHFQLISWFHQKHNIQISQKVNGMYKIIYYTGHTVFHEGKSEFEINEALEVALNLLHDFKKETPTEV